MKTYSIEAATPAAAITLATGNSNTQPILFTNHFGDKGTYENSEGKTKNVELKWVIKDITVTLTRDWDISQAQIVLTCELPDKSMREPPLPDVSIYRGGDNPYLGKEDEIRIYAGYVESSTTPITADLLDEIPFDFTDIKTQVKQSHNKNKPLCPIFWGFIDTMKYSGNPTGSTLTIQCRDRVRVFADTRIVSLVAFQGKQNSERSTKTSVGDQVVDPTATEQGIVSGDRTEILMQLANAAAGNPYGQNPRDLEKKGVTCWKLVKPGEIVKGFTVDQDKNITVQFPSEDPAQWVQTTTCRIMADKATPRFNIWNERPPIVKGESQGTLQVLNKVPLEIIDFIAKTEERPMDFFASHINGDFILGPRVKDESGFADEHRSYRTYFHRTAPDGMIPTYNQMIQKIEATDTTLFSFNNFIIIDSSKTKGGGTSLIGAIRKGYSALSTSLTKRSPSPPCKTQIIYDGGLASYDNPELGATYLAMAHAKIWSRDITGIEMEVVGDPTLYPSEAIRVYNTYLHDYKTYTVMDSTKDTSKDIREYRDDVEKNVAPAMKTETQDQKKDTSADNNLSKAIGKYFANRLPSDIDKFVLPYYSVRVVQHKLTTQGDKGYTTKLSCVSDI
jgi:hypothetical protein